MFIIYDHDLRKLNIIYILSNQDFFFLKMFKLI